MFRPFYLHLKFFTKTSHWSPPVGTFGTLGWDQREMDQVWLCQVTKSYHGAFLLLHF